MTSPAANEVSTRQAALTGIGIAYLVLFVPAFFAGFFAIEKLATFIRDGKQPGQPRC